MRHLHLGRYLYLPNPDSSESASEDEYFVFDDNRRIREDYRRVGTAKKTSTAEVLPQSNIISNPVTASRPASSTKSGSAAASVGKPELRGKSSSGSCETLAEKTATSIESQGFL